MKRVLVAGMVMMAAACGGGTTNSLTKVGTAADPVKDAVAPISCKFLGLSGSTADSIFLDNSTGQASIKFAADQSTWRSITAMQIIAAPKEKVKDFEQQLVDFLSEDDKKAKPMDQATYTFIKQPPKDVVLKYKVLFSCGKLGPLDDGKDNPDKPIDPVIMIKK